MDNIYFLFLAIWSSHGVLQFKVGKICHMFESHKSETVFRSSVTQDRKRPVWNNEPHSLWYGSTRGEISQLVQPHTLAWHVRAFWCWSQYHFLYRQIVEQCRAFNLKHKKIEMVSPTYMVEQYMEKRPKFDHEYVMLSLV